MDTRYVVRLSVICAYGTLSYSTETHDNETDARTEASLWLAGELECDSTIALDGSALVTHYSLGYGVRHTDVSGDVVREAYRLWSEWRAARLQRNTEAFHAVMSGGAI